jgi:hypothetical protein
MAKITFEAWMSKIDSSLERKCGMSSSDLEDFSYRQAYDDGESVSDTVSAVLENSGADEFGID